MLSLGGLDSFVRSARTGSFSAAARQLGLTPAAVSKNVAHLEEQLGARLFHRSTRRLTLTEQGELFLREAGGGLASIQAAVETLSSLRGEPAGTLRVSMPPGFGHHVLLPVLAEFLRAHPRVHGDWHFDMRAVDLVGEGFDAAIGGGFDLAPGLVARELVRIQVIAVASERYLRGRPAIKAPADLAAHDGIVVRSGTTRRSSAFMLRERDAKHAQEAPLPPRVVVTDPDAAVLCALQHLGIALVPVSYAIEALERGKLVRVLPKWSADLGALSIYYASSRHLPAKTRAFIDFLLAHVKREKLAERFLA